MTLAYVTLFILMVSIVAIYWVLGVFSRPVFKEIHDYIEEHHPIFFKKLHEDERYYPHVFAKFPLQHVLLSQHWKLPHDYKLREMAGWYRTLDILRDVITGAAIIGAVLFIIFG